MEPNARELIHCPHCGKELAVSGSFRPASFPFCSKRCRIIDLGAWSDESFVIEGKSMNVEVDDYENEE